MAYTHAKDYLFELAENNSTKGWLKDLIIKIINNNGEISDSELTNTVTQIKTNGASVLSLPSRTQSQLHADVLFRSLTHVSGVCALADNQTIDFSDNLTLLYGQNGSGKSSYFRVLNEIVGGNRETTIRPNIYSGTASPISIKLSYLEGSTTHQLEWDGSRRSISPLNLCSVFDSSYTQSFLKKRSTDNAIVLPYGLHLFTALTSTMDKAKEKLQSEIDSIKRSLPSIQTDNLSEEIERILVQQTYRFAQKKHIESLLNISEEEIALLNEKENALKVLKDSNFEDKLKIVSNEHLLFQSLHNYLSKTLKELNSIFSDVTTLISKLNVARESVIAVKEKIAILSEIGNTNSEDWNAFIRSGSTFRENSGIDTHICPYCRQPLNAEASIIIAAYVTYLSDKSQLELRSLIGQKDIAIAKINSIEDFTILEQFDNVLSNQDGGEELKVLIQNGLQKLKSFKESLKESLSIEQSFNQESNDEFQALFDKLSLIESDYTDRINDLKENLQKKEDSIQALQSEMKPLMEKKSISMQKELFEEWFQKIDHVEELKRCQSEMSTRSISSIAKNASQTLVTDNLKTKFQDELNALGLSKLKVELRDAGASRGQSFSELCLASTNTVTDILSEGEQKGVALALFIAERRMQLSNNPIILDDPVNSLDNVIIAKLIERLSTLGNQIIIFSHNLLLLSSLENLKGIHVCGANQRLSCGKTGLHVFMYKVTSRGRDKKGVITEMKQDNVKNGLLSANRLLQRESISESDNIAISGILRHTIELMIDEKIFCNQIPVRFHGRKNSIAWDRLKELNPDKVLIETLNKLYNRLSGGDLHSGIEHSENPIDIEELQDIYNELNKLK